LPADLPMTIIPDNITLLSLPHTAALDLSGNYLGDVFTAASDGHGGTVVTATVPMPSPHAFAATMADGSVCVHGRRLR
jgi:hypothetical protein